MTPGLSGRGTGEQGERFDAYKLINRQGESPQFGSSDSRANTFGVPDRQSLSPHGRNDLRQGTQRYDPFETSPLPEDRSADRGIHNAAWSDPYAQNTVGKVKIFDYGPSNNQQSAESPQLQRFAGSDRYNNADNSGRPGMLGDTDYRLEREANPMRQDTDYRRSAEGNRQPEVQIGGTYQDSMNDRFGNARMSDEMYDPWNRDSPSPGKREPHENPLASSDQAPWHKDRLSGYSSHTTGQQVPWKRDREHDWNKDTPRDQPWGLRNQPWRKENPRDQPWSKENPRDQPWSKENPRDQLCSKESLRDQPCGKEIMRDQTWNMNRSRDQARGTDKDQSWDRGRSQATNDEEQYGWSKHRGEPLSVQPGPQTGNVPTWTSTFAGSKPSEEMTRSNIMPRKQNWNSDRPRESISVTAPLAHTHMHKRQQVAPVQNVQQVAPVKEVPQAIPVQNVQQVTPMKKGQQTTPGQNVQQIATVQSQQGVAKIPVLGATSKLAVAKPQKGQIPVITARKTHENPPQEKTSNFTCLVSK